MTLLGTVVLALRLSIAESSGPKLFKNLLHLLGLSFMK